MVAAATVAGSAAVMGVNAWAEEPARSSSAPETKTIEPRDAAAIDAERRQQNLWQIAKLEGKQQQREEAAERARKRAEAREQARREAAERRREAREQARQEALQEKRREEAAERSSRSQERTAVAEPSGSPQQIAQDMLSEYGWSQSEFSCLQPLWDKESGWDPNAENPSSGAYGIPQALPGSKMATAGSDWESNPATQIEWGLGYIEERYGTPCAAWEHSESNGWY